MVNFLKLRLTGFKSFVDPTELLIEPGITGIVGPNGCGKSNLVEALRWAMGETSAKRMRGGEMDDVIFGGNTSRPGRNIAEVALFLNNADRKVPAQFNDFDDIEVVRRIERGSGSFYRVNGKEARARDVQLLFADVASGANSPSLVSQGRVGAIITAKPVERRAILEEAAGIAGLHSRRHEAELRLRAAESNLARLDDILITLEGQLQALKKQARQAARYRSLNDRMRRAEAALLHLQWREVAERLVAAEQALATVTLEVGRLSEDVAKAAVEEAEAGALLPEFRQREAEAAAELQRLTLARHALDDEERRVAAALAAVDERLAQLSHDRAREAGLEADAGAAEDRLSAEQNRMEAASAAESELAAAAAVAAVAAQEAVDDIETEHAGLARRIATTEEKALSLDRRAADLNALIERLDQRQGEAAAERDRLAAVEDSTAVEDARAEVALIQADLAQAESDAAGAERARESTLTMESAARDALLAAEAPHRRIVAETEALTAMFHGPLFEAFPPVVDRLNVIEGYEAALGVALGDDLTASLEERAPIRWNETDVDAHAPGLPAGTEPLSRYVTGAPALARRLAQIGVVADEAAGAALCPRLVQGQRLVTRDGHMWRWDGYRVTAGAATAALMRLNQRQRLNDLCASIKLSSAALEAAQARHDQLREKAQAAVEAERQSRRAMQSAFEALDAARERLVQAIEAVSARKARLDSLAELSSELAEDRRTAADSLAETNGERAGLPDLAQARAKAAALGATLADRRIGLIEARGADERLRQDAAARMRRLESIAAERASWAARAKDAGARIETLARRQETAAAERGELSTRPSVIARQRATLHDAIEAATLRRRDAGDRLAEAETRASEAGRRCKAAEALLAQARENRVRAEAAVAQGEEARTTLRQRIAERLDCQPEETAPLAEIDPAAPPLERAAVEARLARLHGERDALGPVNLRAETEAEEQEQQIVGLRSERADLVAAVDRLRQGISSLNREGRERMLAAFERVNTSFEKLFVRLFGGGRAHLKLVDAEDPLDAGLEIMASPPGKRLQVLSLLSGGEQALTALALLFAVFLTNPAPICVLDEVDAPLDDANVDRFCSLVEDLAREGATRFLVITHHRMTMARMDRLYGVTMSERGVSQLVSVDLSRAEEMRATA